MRRVLSVLGLPFVAACYTYLPLTTPEPVVGTRVSLVLSDQGRVDAARQIGPYVMRVEGSLLQATDADYLVAVSDVVDIQGMHSKWMGESVPLARSSVATTFERRLSKSRTVMFAAGMATALIAFIASRNLLGIGGGSPPDGGGGGNGQ